MIQNTKMGEKELPCYICGKPTHISNLKAYPGNNWICNDCSNKLYFKPRRTQFQSNEPKLEKVKVRKYFDPFGDDEFEDEIIQHSIITKKDTKKEEDIERLFKDKSSVPKKEKKIYKCAYCNFQSRYYRNNEICQNCGRKGSLVKVLSSSGILKDVEREQF